MGITTVAVGWCVFVDEGEAVAVGVADAGRFVVGSATIGVFSVAVGVEAMEAQPERAAAKTNTPIKIATIDKYRLYRLPITFLSRHAALILIDSPL